MQPKLVPARRGRRADIRSVTGWLQAADQPACTGAQPAHRQLTYVQFPTQMGCYRGVQVTGLLSSFGRSLWEIKHHLLMEDPFVSGTLLTITAGRGRKSCM